MYECYQMQRLKVESAVLAEALACASERGAVVVWNKLVIKFRNKEIEGKMNDWSIVEYEMTKKTKKFN